MLRSNRSAGVSYPLPNRTGGGMRKATTERFWGKVHITNGCWEWAKARDHGGYGRFYTGTVNVGAHRMAWVLAVGPIPNGLCVLHRCDNPPCVNPDHLFLGTIRDNVHDAMKKGRPGRWIPLTACPKCGGSLIQHRRGKRVSDGTTRLAWVCRPCANAASRRFRQRMARIGGRP